ncbi:hypothetical protein FRC16_003313, partial [Serendipita sp. 398]
MSTDLVQTLPPALRNSIIEWAVALANITKCKYTSVAGLTVVMYDILLLSSDEVRLVWQRPWKNASRFAYLINRYVPPIFLIIANYQLGGFRGPLTHTLQVLDPCSIHRSSRHRHMCYLYSCLTGSGSIPSWSRRYHCYLRVICNFLWD